MVPRQLPSQPQIVPAKTANQNQTLPTNQNKNVVSKPPFWKRLLKSCGIFLIVLVVILICGVAYVAASTGVVNIPVISSIIYKSPVPSRSVQPEDLNSEAIKERVQTEVTKGKNNVEVYVTEGNLTSIITTSKRQESQLENAQVAIIDQGKKIEIFGKIINSNIFVTAVYNTGKDFNGNFQIDRLVNFKMGTLKIPFSIISSGLVSEDSINSLVGSSIIEDALSDEGTGLKISNVKPEEGKIIEYVSIADYNNNQNDSEQNLDESSQKFNLN